MKLLKIVFIGGLTNGKIVLDYLFLNKYVNISLIITHPQNHPVPRYVSIPNYNNIKVIHESDANKYNEIIRNQKPDFIFVAGWSGILNEKLLSIPKLGTIGFHPSKLPDNRGRSVVAWQIEEGYSNIALTMFYYNELPDCGDIIAQEQIKIEYNDYINDVLNKLDCASYNLIKAYFPLLRKGLAPRRAQNINEGNFKRVRDDRDSRIDWDKNAEIIYNKIRAISKPYPGAIGYINNNKYRIWKVIPHNTTIELEQKLPGEHIFEKGSGLPIIKCRDHCMKILDYEKV